MSSSMYLHNIIGTGVVTCVHAYMNFKCGIYLCFSTVQFKQKLWSIRALIVGGSSAHTSQILPDGGSVYYREPQTKCPLCDDSGYGGFMNEDLFPELRVGP